MKNYAIKNSNGDFLNIRVTESDGTPLYNSHKEKRFWFCATLEQAKAQASSLDTETNQHTIVEITEV